MQQGFEAGGQVIHATLALAAGLMAQFAPVLIEPASRASRPTGWPGRVPPMALAITGRHGPASPARERLLAGLGDQSRRSGCRRQDALRGREPHARRSAFTCRRTNGAGGFFGIERMSKTRIEVGGVVVPVIAM